MYMFLPVYICVKKFDQVAALFDGHPDLLDEFVTFCPVGSLTSSTQEVQKSSISPTKLRALFSKMTIISRL